MVYGKMGAIKEAKSLVSTPYSLTNIYHIILICDLFLNAIIGLICFKIEALFLILRRRGCKKSALNFLYHLILSKTSILNLSYIFRNLMDAYKRAEKEQLKYILGLDNF